MDEALFHYVQRFAHLRTDASRLRWPATTRHRAPHKPLLLLAVLDLFAQGSVQANLIEPTAELGELFTLYWARVMPPDQRGNLALPFFHLKSDNFWCLISQPGKEEILDAIHQIRSLSQLREVALGARLDNELYTLLCNEESRNVLRSVLVETYFAAEVQPSLLEQGIINLEAFRYSQELLAQTLSKDLRQTSAMEEYKPEVRNQGFRRAIVTAYDHRCAFCGIRVLTADGHTAVDAAHIIPWSVSHDDRPTNGMSLCRLCHWTFDEGLISVSSQYTVNISTQLTANHNFAGHLATLAGRGIITPDEKLLWPSLDALAWHRKYIFRRR